VGLKKCTTASNNVEAQGTAAVNLAGCTASDSLEKSGLKVYGEGTLVEAKFEGNREHSVYAVLLASVRLD
jgi:hypothetical protein